MKKEQDADQRDDDHLGRQLLAEHLDGVPDQR
jgi:hypothetical protein